MGIIESVAVNPNIQPAPERVKKQQQAHSFFYDVYKNTVAVITGASPSNNNNNNYKQQFSGDSSGFSWPNCEEEWEKCQPVVLSKTNGIRGVQQPRLFDMAADASVIETDLDDSQDNAEYSNDSLRFNHVKPQEIGAPEFNFNKDRTDIEHNLWALNDSKSCDSYRVKSFCDVERDEDGTLRLGNAPFRIDSYSPAWQKTDDIPGGLTVNINEGGSSIDKGSGDEERLKHVVSSSARNAEKQVCRGKNSGHEKEISSIYSSLLNSNTKVKMNDVDHNVDGIYLPNKGSKLGRFYSLHENNKDCVIRPKLKHTTLNESALYKASLYVKVGEYLTLRDNWDYQNSSRNKRCWCDLRPVSSALDNSSGCDSHRYANSENGNTSEDCEYTCHRRLVTLDCTVPAMLDVTATQDDQLIQVKCEISAPLVPKEDITPSDLTLRIDLFNSTAIQGLEMIMEDAGVFRGFIGVHMNLSRAIKMVAGSNPPPIYNILQEEEDSQDRALTSYYVPRDTVKVLHITSETTTQQVITGLLNKLNVFDNPHKFALYERQYETGETNKVRMRRLHDNEHPLWLALLWGTEGPNNRRFVLQENDTGDIPWDAFSLPELNNFLRILDREEQEYRSQVRQKYKRMQARLQILLDLHQNGDGLSTSYMCEQTKTSDSDEFCDPFGTLMIDTMSSRF